MGRGLEGIAAAAQVIPVLLLAGAFLPGVGRLKGDEIGFALADVAIVGSGALGEMLALLTLHDGQAEPWRLVVIYGAVAMLLVNLFVFDVIGASAVIFLSLSPASYTRAIGITVGGLALVAIWTGFGFAVGWGLWGFKAVASLLVLSFMGYGVVVASKEPWFLGFIERDVLGPQQRRMDALSARDGERPRNSGRLRDKHRSPLLSRRRHRRVAGSRRRRDL